MVDKQKTDSTAQQALRRLLRHIKCYRVAIFWVIFGLASLAVADGILYKRLLPKLINEGFIAQNPDFLKIAPLYVLTLFFARGVSTFLSLYFNGYVCRSTVKDFRRRMLKQMMRLPVSFFQNKSPGELISKVNYDTEQLAGSISGIFDTLRAIFIFISMLVVMFMISWRITTILLLIAPILGLYLKFISKKMRVHSSHVQESMGNVTQVANEVVDGYQVIKSFNGVGYESRRIDQTTENTNVQEMKLIFLSAVSVPFMQFIGAFAMAIFIFFVAWYGMSISPGEFTGMLGAMISILRPIKQITAVNIIVQRGIAAAISIFSLLDEPEELDFGTMKVDKIKGNIVFDNVSFAYPNLEESRVSSAPFSPPRYVLKDLNFEIKSGEIVAFVGHSGGGKSTLVSLLPRFFNVSKGTIFIDNHDVREYCLENLREQISLVSQDIVLFNDTIENNIAYSKKDSVSKKEIVAAAQAAFVMEFALDLPNGLQTMIGENGVKLSGGQRQRIAIARAILKNAPILILDEATSALDTESERYIQSALDKLVRNKTTFIIAHRLSTIEKADRILVVNNGKVIEQGTHRELMKQDTQYAKLHQTQFIDA